jgi:hypothetical protein
MGKGPSAVTTTAGTVERGLVTSIASAVRIETPSAGAGYG